MSEANLWEWLRDVALPLGHYSRIESPDTAEGFPDVHCQVGPGVTFTLELKFARQPYRRTPFKDGDENGMRRSQIRWIMKNIRNGGVTFIVAQVATTIFVIPGKYVKRINGASKSKLRFLSDAVLDKAKPVEAAAYFQSLCQEIYNDRFEELHLQGSEEKD